MLEDAENQLSPILRELLSRQYEHYLDIDEQISWFEDKLNQTVKQFDNAKRLMSIPGFGPLTSPAVAHHLKHKTQRIAKMPSVANHS